MSTSFRRPVLAAMFCFAAAGTAYSQPTPTSEPSDVTALKAEIETLKGMLPSQSHTMIDVEYNFANLWFAAKNGDWPLATFYLNETRGHLGWAVRVRSVRMLANGQQLDLRPILKGIEDTALTDLRNIVDKKDSAAFEPAYQRMLAQCQACHQAAEKPFLKTKIPERPPSALIDNRP